MNPYSDENDVGLILAKRDGKYVGYLGLMPGVAKVHGEEVKIIWPTTIFVSPEARGCSVSTLLINTALKMGKVLVCTGMSGMAEPVFRHLNFKPMKRAVFSEINFMRLNISPVRMADKLFSSTLKFLISGKPGKSGSNILYQFLKKKGCQILLKKNRNISGQIVLKEVEVLDESFRPMISAGDYSFPRTLDWINWMLKFRWVKSGQDLDKNESGYYFSDSRDLFLYVPLKMTQIGKNNEDKFLIFSVSQVGNYTRIKLLDHSCDSDKTGKAAVSILLKYATDFSADSIEIPSDLSEIINMGIFKKLFLVEREWRYLFGSEDMSGAVITEFERISPGYFDGDLAFF